MSSVQPLSLKTAEKSLKSVVALLDKAEKASSLSQRVEALKQALAEAQKVDWNSLTSSLSEHASQAAAGLDELVRGKRELLLQRLEEKGVPVKRITDYDRAGPLRLIHKGAKTTLRFGNLELRSIEHAEAEKAADEIADEVRRITTGEGIPENFSKLIEAAVEHARCERRVGPDAWLRLTDIYREFYLAWQRAHFTGKFPKAPKSAEYPLVQFSINLAQWTRKGATTPNGAIFRMRSPSMAQESEALLIPNLSNAVGGEDLLLEARLDRVTLNA